ncbi:MAG: ribosomal protein S18-alanine N-acetyltransferase [Peptostreptococcaceae bacterium]|nr:ribosomal protein S18-alanine N-acetyltransferase [Peptostreptococcaceae bacterium]
MNEDLIIKKMEHEHVDQVYGIEELSFFTPWSKKSIHTEVDNPLGHYIVLMDRDRVIAYGGFWVVMEEANINNVAVAPEYRGRGISRILMDKLIEMAKTQGAKELFLEVRSSNYVAQNLYRSLGFKMIGLRTGYYVDTEEDAIIMLLYL